MRKGQVVYVQGIYKAVVEEVKKHTVVVLVKEGVPYDPQNPKNRYEYAKSLIKTECKKQKLRTKRGYNKRGATPPVVVQ